MLSIGAGVIHISAAGDHTNLPVMFAGFMLVATLQVALGGLLLLRRPSRLLIAGGVAMMLSSVGIWLLSRTAGLPFLENGHTEPIGFKDGVTVLFEIASIPALLLLLSSDLARVAMPPRLASQALALVGAGCFALLTPAMLLDGGEHHSHAEAVAMGIHEHDEDEAHAEGEGHAEGEEHADIHEHADAGSAAHTDGHGQRDSAHGDSAHGDSAHAGDGHGHSPTELASTRDGSHDHGDSGGPQHSHPEGEEHTDDHSDGGHEDGGHGGDEHGDQHGGDDHGDHGDGSTDGEEPISFTYEPAQPAQNGEPARGSAIVFRSESGPYEEGAHSGEFHHGSSAGCNPTPEQQAVADKLYAETTAELEQYTNNPAEALADGFYQVVGPADRFVHMINVQRVFDPTILEPTQVESFMYAMTDRGLMALGGMYILPAEFKDGKVTPTEPKHGPEVGGCLTRWHKHEGWVAGVSTGGTNWEETPEMLHVWTYPGLDPWSHYDGPELSQLWWAWKDVPSFCRISPGGTNVCFP